MTAASSSNGLRSVALWLGSPDRPLFAWLDVPEDGRVVGAAVICPSMGLEAAYSTRGVRHLAHRLVAAGWAALRVDYAATGDSAGLWTDPGLVDEWLDSVRIGIDYVRGLGVRRVAVVGLRLGATLAAAELARGGPVDDLVLWDPCATGRAFLREQSALAAFRRDLAVQWGVLGKNEKAEAAAVSEEGSVEAPGATFSAATVSDLKPLAISTDQTLAVRELILGRTGRSLERATRERLTLAQVESAEVDGQETLFEDQPVTPQPTLDRIAHWLTERDEPATQIAVPAGGASAVHPTNGSCAVRERAVELGPVGLFGIFSEPETHLTPSAPTIVFLNIGLINHQGPDRLWVDLARAWAGDGRVRCLRVDLSGVGDSPVRAGRAELRPFPLDALQDVTDIRGAVTGESGGSIVLIGGCSGADHAVESALFDPQAVSVCVVNPALTPKWWKEPPDPNDAPPESNDGQSWGLSSPALSRLLRRVGRFGGTARRIPNWGWWIAKRWVMSGSPVRTLEKLAHSGVPVVIVAGTGEAGRVAQGEHRRLRALAAAGGVRMEVVPYLEHSLLERASRDRAAEIMTGYVAGLETNAPRSSGA